MTSRTEANLDQLGSDVHFVTAPLRFLWHALLWLLFLASRPGDLRSSPRPRSQVRLAGRFLALGVAGLEKDAPRPGRKPACASAKLFSV